MRLAVSTMSYLDHFSSGLWSFSDFLGECSRLGVQGVEIQDRHAPVKEEDFSNKEPWNKMREDVLAAGLTIAAFSPELFFDTFDKDIRPSSVEVLSINNSKEEEQRIERYLKRIDAARWLGVKPVRIFPAVLPKLKRCAEYAEKKDVILVLENHGGQTNTAKGHIKYIEDVGSRALRINLDTGNYPENRYENIKEAIDSGYVRHVHIKHYGYEEDADLIDHEKVFNWLKEAGYDGWLAIEYEGPRRDEAGNNIEKEVVEKIVQEMQGILSGI